MNHPNYIVRETDYKVFKYDSINDCYYPINNVNDLNLLYTNEKLSYHLLVNHYNFFPIKDNQVENCLLEFKQRMEAIFTVNNLIR